MLKVISVLVVTLISLELSSIRINTEPTKRQIIYNKILKNKSTIDKAYARKLATVIVDKARKHNVSASKYTAILAQESGYKLNAINHKSGDYGISQINHRTAKAFNIDTNRLMYDLEYSVEAGLIVLADFKKRYGHKEASYWSRYNSSNTSKRIAYEKAVQGYM